MMYMHELNKKCYEQNYKCVNYSLQMPLYLVVDFKSMRASSQVFNDTVVAQHVIISPFLLQAFRAIYDDHTYFSSYNYVACCIIGEYIAQFLSKNTKKAIPSMIVQSTQLLL